MQYITNAGISNAKYTFKHFTRPSLPTSDLLSSKCNDNAIK